MKRRKEVKRTTRKGRRRTSCADLAEQVSRSPPERKKRRVWGHQPRLPLLLLLLLLLHLPLPRRRRRLQLPRSSPPAQGTLVGLMRGWKQHVRKFLVAKGKGSKSLDTPDKQSISPCRTYPTEHGLARHSTPLMPSPLLRTVPMLRSLPARQWYRSLANRRRMKQWKRTRCMSLNCSRRENADHAVRTRVYLRIIQDIWPSRIAFAPAQRPSLLPQRRLLRDKTFDSINRPAESVQDSSILDW